MSEHVHKLDRPLANGVFICYLCGARFLDLDSPEAERRLADELHYQYDHGSTSEDCLSCKATAPAILAALRGET